MSKDNQVSYKEIIKQEYMKCAASPVYFMKTYVKIQHPIRGSIKFDLYPFQEETLQSFADYKFNIILKSRQMGISTLVSAYSLWVMIFNKDKNILLISLKQDDAKDVVTKVKFANENLPAWLKIKPTEDNRLSIRFENGSGIKAGSTTKKSGVGQALSLLIIDEAALIEGADELWTSAQPTLSTGGNAIILSCVTKDTMVITSRGIKEVGSFVDTTKSGGYQINPYKIFGNNGLKNGNLFHNNGRVKTYKIETKISSLEASFNHKLWACKNGKYDWYKMEELSVGDWVNIQYGMNVWGNNDNIFDFSFGKLRKDSNNPLIHDRLTPELCYLIGLYFSEGNGIKRYNSNGKYYAGINITCGDDISYIFKKLGLRYYTNDNLHYSVCSLELVKLFQYLGIDLSEKAHQKKMPSRLLEMGKANICAMLSGMFDGDGFSRTDRGTIGINSSSEILIKQIRIILLNLGIRSLYQLITKEYLNERNYFEYPFKYDSHRLELNLTNSRLFYEIVGFKLERKQNNRHILDKLSHVGISHDVIPYSLSIVNTLFDYFDGGSWTLNKKYGLNLNGILNKKTKYKTEHVNSKNVSKLYSIVKEKLPPNVTNIYDKIIINNSEWVKITSIKESENETYDFSLDHTEDFWCHSILYNGILGHNTPRGVGNWFHSMWQGAEETGGKEVGKNGFRAIKLPWDLHPERDQTWRDVEGAKQGNPKKAAQEFDCDFLASGDNVVDMAIIEHYKKNIAKEPLEARGEGKATWIWEWPDRTKSYILSADVARGDGSDFSAAHVLNISDTTPTQAAEYKGTLGTKDFGDYLVNLAIEYNNALLIIERENVGWATIQQVIDREYPFTFYSSSDLKYVDVQRQITNKHHTQDKKLVPGFSTNLKTRPLIINNIDMYFREEAVMIYSKRTLAELETFIWKNGKAQAMSGYNDDLTMSLGIGLWVRDTALRLRQEGMDLTMKSLSYMNKQKIDQTPVIKTTNIQRGQESWRMNIGKQRHGGQNSEDITWLL